MIEDNTIPDVLADVFGVDVTAAPWEDQISVAANYDNTSTFDKRHRPGCLMRDASTMTLEELIATQTDQRSCRCEDAAELVGAPTRQGRHRLWGRTRDLWPDRMARGDDADYDYDDNRARFERRMPDVEASFELHTGSRAWYLALGALGADMGNRNSYRRLVFAALAALADADDRVETTQTRVRDGIFGVAPQGGFPEDRARWHNSTLTDVSRSIRYLADHGWIAIERTGGPGQTSVYRLTVEFDAAGDLVPTGI